MLAARNVIRLLQVHFIVTEIKKVIEASADMPLPSLKVKKDVEIKRCVTSLC